MVGRWWVGGVLVVALVGCGGGGSAVSAASRLPSRPVELRLDGVEACALLGAEQVRRMGVRAGERAEGGGCRWRDGAMSSYLARLIVDQDAESVLNSGATRENVDIDGFLAVRASAPYVDPKNHCVLAVDVADGQALWVQWTSLSGGYPGLSHEVACQRAEEAGRLMLASLRRLSR
ncbi:DUF3558 domain-containing protein [Pseudonocardia acaciae]|uniref:DUF3558 domain-containing protein n=1 Tax=Pseudonocardia acaciae TaxID=551276 RepID=UPI003CCBF62D